MKDKMIKSSLDFIMHLSSTSRNTRDEHKVANGNEYNDIPFERRVLTSLQELHRKIEENF